MPCGFYHEQGLNVSQRRDPRYKTFTKCVYELCNELCTNLHNLTVMCADGAIYVRNIRIYLYTPEATKDPAVCGHGTGVIPGAGCRSVSRGG